MIPESQDMTGYYVQEIPGPRATVKRKRRDLAPFPEKVRKLAYSPRPGVDREAVTNY